MGNFHRQNYGLDKKIGTPEDITIPHIALRPYAVKVYFQFIVIYSNPLNPEENFASLC